jgi:hypothetical protein
MTHLIGKETEMGRGGMTCTKYGYPNSGDLPSKPSLTLYQTQDDLVGSRSPTPPSPSLSTGCWICSQLCFAIILIGEGYLTESNASP